MKTQYNRIWHTLKAVPMGKIRAPMPALKIRMHAKKWLNITNQKLEKIRTNQKQIQQMAKNNKTQSRNC